ncbi:hypothetical protein F511_36967 [Dorcoceras hygrometricum]|uniref:Uncharacterized protein n=1 Tax=Dorcoceras hygrometricum TaxID=472368 RepID=A0A2Z7BA36_9LAMI|nr:hypothetical protein F511_36967 [Dorcoceras hygrometricum]
MLPDEVGLASYGRPGYKEKASTLSSSDIPLIRDIGGMSDIFEIKWNDVVGMYSFSSADNFFEELQQLFVKIQQMLFSRVLSCFAKKCLRQRFDKLERRRGKHSIVSADEVFSRYFVEEVQQLV